MLIKSIIISQKLILRRKENIYGIFIIGITFLLSVILGTYYSTTQSFIEHDIKEDFNSNTLIVSKKYDDENNPPNLKEVRHELEKIENVVGVFSVTSRNTGLISNDFKNNNVSGRVELYAANNKSLPEIIKGTNFPDEKNNYIICPQNFYPNDMEFDNLTKDKFINLEKYLNRTITFEYENFVTNNKKSIDYKLIGIYKNSPTYIDEGTCFVNENSLFEIYKFQREGEKDFDINDQRSFYVQVNNSKNIENVINSLQINDYYVAPTTFIDYKIFDNVFDNIRSFTIVVYIVIFIELLVIIIKIYKDNHNNYNTMSILGINEKRINIIILISNLLLLIYSFIIALIFTFFTNIIIKLLINYMPLIFEKRNIIMNYSWLIYTFGISLIIFILAAFNIMLIRKKR